MALATLIKRLQDIMRGDAGVGGDEQRHLSSFQVSRVKSASAFSKVYGMMPDFWEHPSRCMEDYADGKRDSKARYLIAEKVSLKGVGFIPAGNE